MNGKGWLGLNGITPALVTTGFHSSGSLPIGDIWTAEWLPLTMQQPPSCRTTLVSSENVTVT
jgi:hypothetical protein